jgi:hypothetical protein
LEEDAGLGLVILGGFGGRRRLRTGEIWKEVLEEDAGLGLVILGGFGGRRKLRTGDTGRLWRKTQA